MKLRNAPRSRALTLRSPAKINLFFRILGKRSDGFHEIASLMQAVSLYDHLEIEVGAVEETPDETNLVTRGLKLFRERTGIDSPVRIALKKVIPIGGGLGGGSGDLATTLFALNRLCETDLSDETLAQMAGELSSDAPFFFSHGTAYATGRGEIIKDLPPLKPQKLWLARPDFGFATPLAFSRCTPHPEGSDPYELMQSLRCENDLELPGYENDLELPVFTLKPELKVLKEALINLGFETVCMSGSGTTFFCLGEALSPSLPGIHFTPVEFVSRKAELWY